MQKTVWSVLDFVQGGLHSRLELIRGTLLMLDEHVGALIEQSYGIGCLFTKLCHAKMRDATK